METLVGDHTAFLDSLFAKLAEAGIDVSNYEMDHLCYRVETEEAYKQKQAQFYEIGSKLLSEAIIGGRKISTFKIPKPLEYKQRQVSVIELPMPKATSPHKEGLEHAEFVVINEGLEEFTQRHPSVKWLKHALKKSFNADVEVQFSPSKEGERQISAKFHLMSLEKVIEIENQQQS